MRRLSESERCGFCQRITAIDAMDLGEEERWRLIDALFDQAARAKRAHVAYGRRHGRIRRKT